MRSQVLRIHQLRALRRVFIGLTLLPCAALVGCGLRTAPSQQGSSLLTNPDGQTVVVVKNSENLQVCFDQFSTLAGKCNGLYRVNDGELKTFTGGTCFHENLVEEPEAAAPLSLICTMTTEDETKTSCLDAVDLNEVIFAAESLDDSDVGAGTWRSAEKPEEDYITILQEGTCQQFFAPPSQNGTQDTNCGAIQLTQTGFALTEPSSAKCFPADDLEHPTDLACIIRNMALEIYSNVQFDDATFHKIGRGELQPDRCYVTDPHSQEKSAWIVAKDSRGATPSTGGFLNYKYYTTTGEVRAARSFLTEQTPIQIDYKPARDPENNSAGVITSDYITLSGNWKTVKDQTTFGSVKTLVYQAGSYAVRWVPKTYCPAKYLKLAFPSAVSSSTDQSTAKQAQPTSQTCAGN